MEKTTSDAINKLVHGVYVIGTCAEEKENLMTAAWVSQAAGKEPMLTVAIGKSHYTLELIEKGQEFTVSVLAADQKEIAQICGTRSGRRENKVKQVPVDSFEGIPVVRNAAAWLKCRLFETYPAGDHILVLAEVTKGVVGEKNPMEYHKDEFF